MRSFSCSYLVLLTFTCSYRSKADFCTSLVRAHSVISLDRGGQAAFVTRGRMFTILLSLATRLILVEAEPVQETGKESRYVVVNVHLLWPWANLALSTVYE
ncbi:hypothetical protein BDY19DRAFT_975882, partial [Irpex rosettiformis]